MTAGINKKIENVGTQQNKIKTRKKVYNYKGGGSTKPFYYRFHS